MKTPTNLQGYQAADKVVEDLMRSSHEVRPKKQGNRKSADYRSGYADGLLAAHCLLVMGSHPKQNEKEIWEILKADNAQNSAERVDEWPTAKPKETL
jgi:hypothetical protein